MGGEHDRQRNDPTFSDETLDQIDDEAPAAQVDLDQLLNEINGGMADHSPAPPGSPPNQEFPEPGDDEPWLTAAPAQSALDFGEAEQEYERAQDVLQPEFTDKPTMGEEEMSRGVMMAGGALVALSLLCGVAGLFVGFSASGKIDALQQSVDTLQTRLATLQVSGDPRVGQLQAEQAGLTSRIDELATMMESQAATPVKGNDSQLAELRKRLETLERKAAQPVKSVTVASTSTSTRSISSKPAASSGDWTVILVSFATAVQADSERARLQKLGLRAEVFKSLVDGKTWYRVRVPGYASQESAKAAIPALDKKSGIDGAWVAHR